jgi:serine/threonine protein kinase
VILTQNVTGPEEAGTDGSGRTIHPIRCIGSGEFGQVWGAVLAAPERPPALVAAKMLHPESSCKTKRDFANEAALLGRFEHVNVLRQLFANPAAARAGFAVLELIEFGDLRGVLLRARKHGGVVLTATEAVAFLAQIAAGMCHVAALKVVHRDLALRNCLLGLNNVVKVADFGLGRAMAACDGGRDLYLQQDTAAALPLRWMAIEASEALCPILARLPPILARSPPIFARELCQVALTPLVKASSDIVPSVEARAIAGETDHCG